MGGTVRSIVVLVALLAGAPARAEPGPLPPDGSFFRVTLDGGVSPFTSVAWDVTVRGRSVVLSLVKESLCLKGQRERVRVLDGADAAAVLAALERAGAWKVTRPDGAVEGRRSGTPPAGAPRYEFWLAWGREMRRFTADQATVAATPALVAAFGAVRDEARARLEPLPMRDVYHPAERLGWLTMTATEPAKATLDGWDTVSLPVDALEVVEGDHAVVVRGVSGRSREFRVHVVAGTSSQVHVVLEGER